MYIFCVFKYVGGNCTPSTSQSLVRNAATGSAEVKQSQLFQHKFTGNGLVAKQHLPSVKTSEFLTELKDHLQKNCKDCRSLPYIYYSTSEKSYDDMLRYAYLQYKHYASSTKCIYIYIYSESFKERIPQRKSAFKVKNGPPVDLNSSISNRPPAPLPHELLDSAMDDQQRGAAQHCTKQSLVDTAVDEQIYDTIKVCRPALSKFKSNELVYIFSR